MEHVANSKMSDPFQLAIEKAMTIGEPTKWLPYFPGTLVTGHNFNGTFGIIGHKGHVFSVGKAEDVRKGGWSNSGYLQEGFCIVCEHSIGRVDAEWWQRKATKEDIKRCVNEMAEARNRLTRARNKLLKILEDY